MIGKKHIKSGILSFNFFFFIFDLFYFFLIVLKLYLVLSCPFSPLSIIKFAFWRWTVYHLSAKASPGIATQDNVTTELYLTFRGETQFTSYLATF